MKLATEIFGLVAGLFRFTTEHEVIDVANDTEIGLESHLFSRDIHRAWTVARALRVGIVGVNTSVITDVASADATTLSPRKYKRATHANVT